MWEVEYEDRGVGDSGFDRGVGFNVLGKGYAREVFEVLVVGVD